MCPISLRGCLAQVAVFSGELPSDYRESLSHPPHRLPQKQSVIKRGQMVSFKLSTNKKVHPNFNTSMELQYTSISSSWRQPQCHTLVCLSLLTMKPAQK